MNSVTLFTNEIDFADDAVAELKSQLEEKLNKGFEKGKNSIGIVFCDPDLDIEEFLAESKKAFDFPMVGCTSHAAFSDCGGYSKTGITVMVLSADDCEFHYGITGDCTIDNAKERFEETYLSVKKELKEPEKLILTYCGKIVGFGGDEYGEILSELAPNVPIYGAFASDHFAFQKYKVFAGDSVCQFGMIMILISGNINPIFKIEQSLSKRVEIPGTVNKVEDVMIYEIGGKRFTDILEENNLDTTKEDTNNVSLEYVGTPFLFESTMEDGTKVSYLRNLTGFQRANGVGRFLGKVREGSKASIGVTSGDDVKISVSKAVKEMAQEIGRDDKFNTILCNSCSSRYLVLMQNPSAEYDAVKEYMQEGKSFSAFYSYGEMCPIFSVNGKVYNTFHNITFTMLAL